MSLVYKGSPVTLKRIVRSLYYRTIHNVIIKSAPLRYRLYQSVKIRAIRKKEKINVLFIVAELGAWKTEELYRRMLTHPRFNPYIVITSSLEAPISKDALVAYLRKQEYDFLDVDSNPELIDKLEPDIKFYYKPYEGSYPDGVYFDRHLKSLTCVIFYSFNMGGGYKSFRHPIRKFAWKEFVENGIVRNTMRSVKGIYSGNKVVTGLPMQDQLCKDKSAYDDPWKPCVGKKRIIYAPHHSLKGSNGDYIEYSTFLENGEFILSLAKKYKDQLQWAFKPHPTLYPKLIKRWGKEKTDQYYNEWRDMENSQLEVGKYDALFMHSDAMIHDCSSFIVEYLYAHKPVLFLEEHPMTAEQLMVGEFPYRAYQLHEHASSHQGIEDFVKRIIAGEKTSNERDMFFKEFLTPPNGQSACDNIIDVILGQGAYKYIL